MCKPPMLPPTMRRCQEADHRYSAGAYRVCRRCGGDPPFRLSPGPAPAWAVRGDAAGVYRVEKDGKAVQAGPWPSAALAQQALGYLAWVDAGGSAD